MAEQSGLSEVIENLIALKHEGAYWDFKKQWYEEGKNADMLHDIICMTNNLVDRDAYIIIGVDEENDYRCQDISNDQNRRNTQKITDFLKDKKFTGDIRPQVHVESLNIDDCVIDVIVVENIDLTPVYLKESYRDVNANNIYTRVQDTNTPKGKGADIDRVEYLWKKRFGLLYTPLEKIFLYMENPDLWCDDANELEMRKFYQFSPEYTIQIVDKEDGRSDYQYYLFDQCDSSPHWASINLYYHQTALASYGAMYLDGGRYFTPCPRTEGVSFTEYHHWDLSYKYMVKGSPEYRLNLFFFDRESGNQISSRRDFMDNILLFESDREHEAFREYLRENWQYKEQYSGDIVLPYFPEIEGYNIDVMKEQYINARILNRMLRTFRKKYLGGN